MPVFYPFGIPTTSSFAETASLALFTDLEEPLLSASFAEVARLGPSGSNGQDALPADCARYSGSEFREFPTLADGYNLPDEVIAARQTYILCVIPLEVPDFVVPAHIDGGAPNTINFDLNIDGGEPETIHGFIADGGNPSTNIP
jgi:hypothetical protein